MSLRGFIVALFVAVLSFAPLASTAEAYTQPLPRGHCITGNFIPVIYFTAAEFADSYDPETGREQLDSFLQFADEIGEPLESISMGSSAFEIRNERYPFMAFYVRDKGAAIELAVFRLLERQNGTISQRIERVGDIVWITRRPGPSIDLILSAGCKARPIPPIYRSMV